MRVNRWVMVCGIILLMILIIFAGKFLVITEEPRKSDAIIILSGGDYNLEKGLELYNEGYAPFLILSNALDDGMMEQLNKAGVPSSSLILETKADSTYTNALYTKELMIKHQFKSAMIVTPDFHMRRVKYHFEKMYKGTGIIFTYTPVKTPTFDPRLWWLDKYSARVVINEYLKFAGNIFGIEGHEYKKFLF